MPSVSNTTIKILKDVPLDSTYTDTMLFSSVGEQTSYFNSKVKYAYTGCSYQRVNSSVAPYRRAYTVTVPGIADNYEDCNYIMFQNSGTSSKWYYCFIKKIEYISQIATKFEYEIDYYQTWAFDFEILPSIVEREHAESDELFENLEPEPFNVVADYITDPPITTQNIDPHIAIMATTDPDGKGGNGYLINNIFQNTIQGSFPANNSGLMAVLAILDEYAQQGTIDNIVNIYMLPKAASLSGNYESLTANDPKINNYSPKNKKLLSFPYCHIQVDNGLGDTAQYKYEDFADYLINNDGNITVNKRPYLFYCYYFCGYPPAMVLTCTANGYQNKSNPNCLSITNFPQCAWSKDSYTAWLANTNPRSTFNIAQNAIRPMITGAASGNTSQTIAGIGEGILNLFLGMGEREIEKFEASRNSYTMGGMASPATVPFITKDIGFHIYNISIKPEIAQQIDDYFDMFGYATNKLKVPNLNSRETWNYVKTNNVMIKGSMPVDAMNAIKRMFNNGIRFWHTDNVGNYTLRNRIVGDANE